MARLRYNGLTATLGGSGLTTSATSVTFSAALTYNGAAATPVPTLSGSDYLPLTILDSSGNVSEIVSLTAYTSGATTGTISRAQEGTTGVAHSSGDKVVHGPTTADLGGSGAGGTSVHRSAVQNISSSTWTAVSWDVEDYDDLAAHDNATNNSRITVPSTGLYLLDATVTSNANVFFYVQFAINGTRLPGRNSGAPVGTAICSALSRLRKLTAGDYVEVYVYGNGAFGVAGASTYPDDYSTFEVAKIG